jgi:ferric-dicitrate binding protein FerR (iron transport regulator)
MVALGPHHPWLEPGEQVVTGPGSQVALELAAAEGSIQVGPDSAVAWAPETLGQQLELAAGRIRLWFVKARDRKFGHTYNIRTPACVLADRGTTFEVAIEPNGATLCTVTEGTVDVSDREGRVTRAVSEGQRIRIPRDHVPGQPLPEPERFDVTPLPGAGARP